MTTETTTGAGPCSRCGRWVTALAGQWIDSEHRPRCTEAGNVWHTRARGPVRCDACGRMTTALGGAPCPGRDCAGTLRPR